MSDVAGGPTPARTNRWKQIAWRAFFAGLGVVIGAAGILGAWLWLASRPTPPESWKEDTVRSKGAPSFKAMADTLEFSYVVHNTADVDYSVEDDSRLRVFVRTVEDSALSPLSSDAVRTPIFIPGRETGFMELKLVFPEMPLQAPTEPDSAYHETLRRFLNERCANVREFVIYDDQARCKLVLPRWLDKRMPNDQN